MCIRDRLVISCIAKGGRKRARRAMPTSDTSGHNGVGEFSCSLCETVIDNDKEIQCKMCACYFHHICANISESIFEVPHTSLPSVSWVCQECIGIISEMQALTDAVRKLEDHTEFKQKMMTMSTMVEGSNGGQLVGAADVTGVAPPNQKRNTPSISNISQVVSQTVKDQLRQKNIIVSGLPESSGESDVDALRSLCEQHLDCKLWLDETKCRRIGKTTRNHPR